MRVDPVVLAVLALQLAVPLVLLWSFAQARRRVFLRHRRTQIALVIACFVAVACLEVRIRVAGGSGALLADSAWGHTTAFHVVFGTHVSIAVLTYLAWGWLSIVSARRFETRLPGTFSRLHRRIGWCVFAGLCTTALTASAIFVFAFVR